MNLITSLLSFRGTPETHGVITCIRCRHLRKEIAALKSDLDEMQTQIAVAIAKHRAIMEAPLPWERDDPRR